jgi:hypothetical protein
MLRPGFKLILATGGVAAVLGSGVALAADPSTCPWGNTPQAAKTVTASQTNRDRVRLRKRDGTGPRHAQQMQRNRPGTGQGRGGGVANHGANCSYRR